MDGKDVDRGGHQAEDESTVQMVCVGGMKNAEALSTKGVFTPDDFREEFISEFGGPAMAPPTNDYGIDHNGT